jgi:sphinganine-1-phosphate aldolase
MSEIAIQFPQEGQTKEAILEKMRAVRQKDINWQQGKAFSLVFHAGEEVTEMLKEAYMMFFSENGLNPTAFPSLRKFESEVVAMSANLLGGDANTSGSMTSGGTESILMAVKTAREWARATKPEIVRPEMILPSSAHPAFEKAGHYFGVKPVHVPVRADFRADLEATQAAITPQTILMVGSAPSYPQGVVDPIPCLAEIAQEHNILMHVDACVGGFMLPFVRQLGYPVPEFGFEVPGVTSLSADLHKYGYAAKGASVILYRDRELRRHQFFVHTDWSGGIYASPTMTGTRPGGAIAAAWAIMNYLGQEGYLRIADCVMQTTQKMRKGVEAIPELNVLSDPEMSVFAIASHKYNIYEIGDEMGARGWHLDRQQFPPSLHVTVNYAHANVADEFINDLQDSLNVVKKPSLQKTANAMIVRLANGAAAILPEKWISRLTKRVSGLIGGKGTGLPERTAAMYGMIGTLPNRGDINQLVLDLLDRMTYAAPVKDQEAMKDGNGDSNRL